MAENVSILIEDKIEFSFIKRNALFALTISTLRCRLCQLRRIQTF